MNDYHTQKPSPAARGLSRYLRERESHRKGSAIILVIVSIVLIAILGATMVQVARFERLTTSEENIDVVVASVLDLIAVRLGEDIVDDNGNIFNPGSFATGGGDEPFDYPYTRPNTNGGFTTELIDGSTPVVWGGIFDDMWLASTEPNGTWAVWPHITNLTGMYLVGSDLSANAQPTEQLVNVAGWDSNVTINNQLIDADGDGIGDSRWAWAPLKQVGGTRYVMAVRIIDLSARLDANVALSQIHTNAATPNVGEGKPRGDSPVEIDGGTTIVAYASQNSVVPATALAQWEATMSYRFSGNATGTFATAVPIGDRNTTFTRRHYWYRGAARVATNFARFGEVNGGAGYDYETVYGTNDAFELLQNNGLNTSATTTLEDHMPLVLRRDNGTEAPAATAQAHFQWNTRLMLSPFTGSGDYAKPAAANNSEFVNYGRRVDINQATPTELATAISSVIGAGGFNFGNNANVPNAATYSAQFAVNLKDYADEDNWVSTLAGGITYYGFEALPMITEVYAERGYSSTSTDNGDGTTTVTWDGTGSEATYAIEIVNPYHRPIKLTDVQLRVGGAAITGGADDDLASLAGLNWLEPGESIVVYHEDPATYPGADFVATRVAGTPTSVSTTALFPNGDPVPVTLHAKQDTTDSSFTDIAGVTPPATYIAQPYQQADAVGMPNTFTEVVATGTQPVDGTVGYRQASSQGAGPGLNAIHVTATEFNSNGATTLISPNGNLTPQDIDALGNPNKPGDTKGLNIDDQQIVHQDSPIRYVGDILQVPVFGFDSGATFAQQLESAGIAAGTRVLENMMMPYDSAAARLTALNVPHGIILLDRLTAYSPFEDGEDNNGDGTVDSEGEFLVPGRINLNTAPQRLLEYTLPFPELARRRAIAQAIVAERNSGASSFGYGPAAANGPGLDYVGELYEVIRDNTHATTSTSADGNTRALNGHNIDWNDFNTEDVSPATTSTTYTVPEPGGGTKTFINDDIADDREEQIMLAKWLSEVGSTRSDVFAAYIIVQGYPAADFTAGASESAKLLAIFTRANVRDAGDKAEILAVLRIE